MYKLGLEEAEEKKAKDRTDYDARTPDAHLRLEVVIIMQNFTSYNPRAPELSLAQDIGLQPLPSP